VKAVAAQAVQNGGNDERERVTGKPRASPAPRQQIKCLPWWHVLYWAVFGMSCIGPCAACPVLGRVRHVLYWAVCGMSCIGPCVACPVLGRVWHVLYWAVFGMSCIGPCVACPVLGRVRRRPVWSLCLAVPDDALVSSPAVSVVCIPACLSSRASVSSTSSA